ncbi:hypothetical protein [Pseudomonas syringae]|uniref:hypothetical protein n=1 Tax=Pseudomonas syringae TaxID=317 RepID=UPI00067A0552|nr:hypothetical protein [Pseudomonas syringae]AKT32920.1 hypothetical protein IYO_026025 [Pseudomonas syringae pv. actinidiae ICMP 18884]AOE59216.1 hypothetical protein NZ708_25895 [Pseudomonas syringae pv. actinidiae ICMP 18708]APQ00168.1 hypothetical protein PsaNZ45_26450 [Pseudomonas syringae pv. actinidiae]APQ05920.1 hypothetical protein PsaNZ47_25860 [Pseudomonas syringae pv. actinidiae]AQX61458.1 hypothetical protein B1R35_27805 [Pseudomonas syringae pv. actinidiae]
MTIQQAMHQMPGKPGRDAIAEGEAPRKASSDEAGCPRHDSTPTGSGLLQAALTRDNLQLAFKQVRANKGAAGVDGLGIAETAEHLKTAAFFKVVVASTV